MPRLPEAHAVLEKEHPTLSALDHSMPDLSVIGPSAQQKLRHFLNRVLSVRTQLQRFC